MKSVAASAVEMPPNKAIASGGGASLAGAAVAVLIWASGAQPPAEVIVAMTTLANAIGGFLATYLVPHGAVMK